jgi:hypothetical protein
MRRVSAKAAPVPEMVNTRMMQTAVTVEMSFFII